VDVREDDVEGARAHGLDELESGLGTRGFLDREALVTKGSREGADDTGLVVYDEDPTLRIHAAVPPECWVAE
jgi:hypothetical protein